MKIFHFFKKYGILRNNVYNKKFERGILMILSCQNICKTFVEKPVLQNISFHLNENDRLAIIGYNGAGKSTLLKILIGEISYDEGEISLKKDASIGYLAQHQDHTFHHTIFDELLSVKKEVIELNEQMRTYEQEMKHLTGDALEQKMNQYTNATHRFEQLNGFAYKSEITGILKGLGFSEEDFTKEINTLSGGQRTRVALGKLLLKNPDILLLDEPTNHLDVDSIRWLENYLSHYKGAVIIVSHDRYFLDKIVNKVMEIDQGHSMLFDGNYTTFIEKRDQIKAIRLKEYKNQQQEIKHQQEVIKKLKQFNREKSIKRAESREKALNKIDVLEKPTEYNADMRLSIEPEIISGNDVLTLKDVSKSFGNKSLFHGLSADIFREERVALIGPNGTGKTTLLKIICKKISNNGGTISLGAGVSIGFGADAGAELTISGFTATYGNWISIFTAVALCCFAFSTIIGWGLYGARCIEFLFSSKVIKPFMLVYSLVAILGATVDLGMLWSIAETFNGLMAIPNLIALFLLSGTVVKLVKNYFHEK